MVYKCTDTCRAHLKNCIFESERQKLQLKGQRGIIMYERMLDKQNRPAFDDMAAYCGKGMELFVRINEWLLNVCNTTQEISFP